MSFSFTPADRGGRVYVVLRLGAAVGLVLAAVALSLGGCSENGAGGGGDSIAVAGTWVLETDLDGDGTADSSERWTVTHDEIHYETSFGGLGYVTSYRADIVDVSNNGLNGGDTTLTGAASHDAVDPGFAVIEYTEAAGPSVGEVGAYNVFRWADNVADPSKKDFTQGSKDADRDGDGDPTTNYVNDVFDSPDAAEAGATNAGGYFAFASRGAVKQDE
jgi:hypothetical protein